MKKKQYMSFRLDDNVTIAFLVTCVIASFAFVVRYQSYTPCEDFDIKVLTDKAFTGTSIRFEASASTKHKNFEWDFGDRQETSTEVNSAIHSYDRAGEYLVTLRVDGRCMQTKTIFVQQAAEIIDVSRMPKAIIPSVTEVGKPTTFTDTTSGANAWEWRFGENENVDAFVKVPVYTFRQPGWKTVTLTVNGNNKSVLVAKIFVNPPKEQPMPVQQQRPRMPRNTFNREPVTEPLEEQLNPEPEQQASTTPPTPKVVKAPDISIAEFKGMLYGIADKKNNAGQFSKYFCDGNLNAFTTINGEPSTFNEFCSKLAALKKSSEIKNMTVTPKKNRETNCITSVDVIIRKKTGLLGVSGSSRF